MGSEMCIRDSHKDYIRSQVKECISEFSMCKEEQQWFDLLHSELDKSQTDERRARYANDFVRAELALNKIRGTDTLTIEPMLQRYFDRYDPDNVTQGSRPGAHFDGKQKPTV